MCNKSVDTCPFVFNSVPDRYKTQEICYKAVSKDPFMLKYCHDRYKTPEKRDKAVSKYPFQLKYCHDRYKIQELCDKTAHNFLPALTFVPNWFVRSNMVKKLQSALFADDDIFFLHEGSGHVILVIF